MEYVVYVQGIEVARFTKRFMADWFASKLKSFDDSDLHYNITEIINYPSFQDCEISISEYDTSDI